jgi:uncharacterized protein involved in exopolysaccharide biosynthesis
MNVGEYWRIFKRRAWLPTLLVGVTVLTAGGVALLSRPTYVATATVQARMTGSSGTTPAQTLSFQEVVASNTLALAVVNKLSLDDTPAALSKRIHVTAGHSDLYTVTITDPSADRATAIANAVAQEASQLYQEKNATASSSLFLANVETERASLLKRFTDAERALLTFEAQHPKILQSSDVDLALLYRHLQLDQQAASAAYQTFEQQTTTETVRALSQANNFLASVLDPAVARPDTISRYLNVAYAAALALLLSLGLIYLLEQQARARMIAAVFKGAEDERSGRYGYSYANGNER